MNAEPDSKTMSPAPQRDAAARPSVAKPVMAITAAGTMVMAGYEMVRSASASVFLAHHSAAMLPEALMLAPQRHAEEPGEGEHG